MVALFESVARRLIIVIVATGVVGGIGGLVIGRYVVPSKGHGPDSASVQPQTVPSASPPAATPTALVPAPPSTKPSQAPAGTTGGGPVPAGTSIPGVPTQINEFGIPVGYPHTQAGAISACANYVSAYSAPGNREPTRIKQILGSISESSATSRLSQTLISVNNQTAKNFGVTSVNSPNFQLEFRTLGYKVDNFQPDKAKIYIWSNANAGVIDGAENFKPRDFWGTDLCTVSWNGADWKLSDATNGPDGPDPAEQRSEEFQSFLLIGAVA